MLIAVGMACGQRLDHGRLRDHPGTACCPAPRPTCWPPRSSRPRPACCWPGSSCPRDAAVEEAQTYDPRPGKRYDSSIDALIKGTTDGLQIVLNVGATLIVFVALAAMVNNDPGRICAIGWATSLTVERRPGQPVLARGLGDRRALERGAGSAGPPAGRPKLVLTEFTAFIRMARRDPGRRLDPRTRMLDDLRPVRLRQHRLGGHQPGRVLGAGARSGRQRDRSAWSGKL